MNLRQFRDSLLEVRDRLDDLLADAAEVSEDTHDALDDAIADVEDALRAIPTEE